MSCSLANNASEYLVALAAAGYTLDDIKKMVDDVIRARDDMIGTKEERVANGGKARFETHWRAEPLKGAPRCYGLNNMVQIPRRVESTPAKLKTFNDTHDSYQKTVHLFVGVSLSSHIRCVLLMGSFSRPRRNSTAPRFDCRHRWTCRRPLPSTLIKSMLRISAATTVRSGVLRNSIARTHKRRTRVGSLLICSFFELIRL